MSASVIAPASLLRTIASLQAELASLQAALGVEGIVIAAPKGTKVKKIKDPSAEPKEPNVWIKFTQRVGSLIKENNLAVGAPATLGKQFCSFLKEQKPYADWDDAAILEAFASWERPETSKMEAAGKTKKAKADSASESGSVSEPSEKKPRAARGPLTDEAKAARKEKMAAKKAAAVPLSETPAAAPAPPAAAPAAFKPKAVAKPVYTMEQLTDLDGFDHEGVSYGRNIRGDVVSEDGSYVGHWDGKALKKGAAPADWEAVKAAM